MEEQEVDTVLEDAALADAAMELRAIAMFSLAASVERARRLLGEVARSPASAVRLAAELEGFHTLSQEVH